MPDRFATGASAIRPTPDAHLSRFHWDRLASSGGKRPFAQAARMTPVRLSGHLASSIARSDFGTLAAVNAAVQTYAQSSR
jgi:hypothetical protein